MCHIRSKLCANNAMPSGAMSRIKFFLNICSDFLLHSPLVNRLDREVRKSGLQQRVQVNKKDNATGNEPRWGRVEDCLETGRVQISPLWPYKITWMKTRVPNIAKLLCFDLHAWLYPQLRFASLLPYQWPWWPVFCQLHVTFWTSGMCLGSETLEWGRFARFWLSSVWNSRSDRKRSSLCKGSKRRKWQELSVQI